MTDYYVVKLVTDFELLVNMGADSGINEGTILEVLDPTTLDVEDPVTGENLGSLERPKARVVVVTVGEKMTLCRVMNRSTGGSISAVSRVLSGETPPPIAGSRPAWPEGVTARDPVRRTGTKVKELTN